MELEDLYAREKDRHRAAVERLESLLGGKEALRKAMERLRARDIPAAGTMPERPAGARPGGTGSGGATGPNASNGAAGRAGGPGAPGAPDAPGAPGAPGARPPGAAGEPPARGERPAGGGAPANGGASRDDPRRRGGAAGRSERPNRRSRRRRRAGRRRWALRRPDRAIAHVGGRGRWIGGLLAAAAVCASCGEPGSSAAEAGSSIDELETASDPDAPATVPELVSQDEADVRAREEIDAQAFDAELDRLRESIDGD